MTERIIRERGGREREREREMDVRERYGCER